MTSPATTITDLIDLGGRRAFVTGGAAGIGAAIARRFVEAGASVTIGDIAPDVADVAAAFGAVGVRCDITVTNEVEAALDAAAGDGVVDIVVNNAGIFPTTGPMLNATDDFVHRMLDVNVRAQFSVAREAAKRMSAGGSIVNMASVAALGGGANISAYSASKAGVVAFDARVCSRTGSVGNSGQRHRTGHHRHPGRAGADGAAQGWRTRHREAHRRESGRSRRSTRSHRPRGPLLGQ